MMNIDRTDLRILRHLEQNGKITNQELADAAALSVSACFRRVKLLEDSGVIAGYRCIIGNREVGLGFETLVNVSMRTDSDRWHENFVKALDDWPEVIEARIVSGQYNYVLTVRTSSLDHYSDFVINKLHKSPGVMSISSSIVLATLKQNGSLVALLEKG